MAAIPKPGGMSRFLGLTLGVLAALPNVHPAAAQTRISLEQLETRKPPEFTALYDGRIVVIQGVVSADAYHLPGFTILPIQEGQEGAVLQMPQESTQLFAYHPGDELEAEGTVSSFFGMVTLLPAHIKLVGRKRAPVPLTVPVRDLVGNRYVGMLARTEGRITEANYNSGGAFLVLSSSQGP